MPNFVLDEEDLETRFNEAANVVQTNAGSDKCGGVKASDSQLLDLYGLYKVATVGPCNEAQPGMFSMRARAKWNSWKTKSDLSQKDAMSEYINQVMSIFNWDPSNDCCTSKKKTVNSSGFGPAVSRPHHIQEDINDKETPFGWVKDNDVGKIHQWISEGDVNLNLCDEEGLSLLHWAADRGHAEICKILLAAGANPNVQDPDEQTPLEYAITCEHDDIIKLFQSHRNSNPSEGSGSITS